MSLISYDSKSHFLMERSTLCTHYNKEQKIHKLRKQQLHCWLQGVPEKVAIVFRINRSYISILYTKTYTRLRNLCSSKKNNLKVVLLQKIKPAYKGGIQTGAETSVAVVSFFFGDSGGFCMGTTLFGTITRVMLLSLKLLLSSTASCKVERKKIAEGN